MQHMSKFCEQISLEENLIFVLAMAALYMHDDIKEA